MIEKYLCILSEKFKCIECKMRACIRKEKIKNCKRKVKREKDVKYICIYYVKVWSEMNKRWKSGWERREKEKE